jgi:hypothetical protein
LNFLLFIFIRHPLKFVISSFWTYKSISKLLNTLLCIIIIYNEIHFYFEYFINFFVYSLNQYVFYNLWFWNKKLSFILAPQEARINQQVPPKVNPDPLKRIPDPCCSLLHPAPDNFVNFFYISRNFIFHIFTHGNRIFIFPKLIFTFIIYIVNKCTCSFTQGTS